MSSSALCSATRCSSVSVKLRLHPLHLHLFPLVDREKLSELGSNLQNYLWSNMMVIISRVISNVKTKERLLPCSLTSQVTRSSRVVSYLHLWVFIIIFIIFTATFLLLPPSHIFSHQYFPQFPACPSLLSVNLSFLC